MLQMSTVALIKGVPKGNIDIAVKHFLRPFLQPFSPCPSTLQAHQRWALRGLH